MNVFRLLGDLSHTSSKVILIWAIHSNKSAEGVSLLTQLLYILVFGTRYLDLFWVPPWWSWWNTILKIFYIGSSGYIVWLMMRVYARTREKEYAWKLATYSLTAAFIAAAPVCWVFEGWERFTFAEVLWTFSIILESLCVLPQLLLLRQTAVPTVLDSYYLVALGSYRAFYILNWIWRLASSEHHFDPISVIFGIIQTALYVDFAWVYYTRQRVKLRGGGVVDSDDLSKSFLVRRIIGRGSRADTEDDGIADEDEGLHRQENGTIHNQGPGQGQNRWGARGISVSADDTLDEHDRRKTPNGPTRGDGGGFGEEGGGFRDDTRAGDAQMIDPAHFEDDDDDDDDDADAPPPPVAKDDKYKSSEATDEGEGSQSAWAEDAGDLSDAGKKTAS